MTEVIYDRRAPTGVEATRPIYTSSSCEVDLERRELRVLGSRVAVGSHAFEILEILVQAGGDLITKNELMAQIWPGAIVMDSTLHVHASSLRKALGPYRHLLKTESRRGYRLLGQWSVGGQAAVAGIVGPERSGWIEISPANNLPAKVSDLVGRETALQELLEFIATYRAVTLVGPGGIGKTVLAIDLGRRVLAEYNDGAWLVELASLNDASLVLPTVAGVLGLTCVGELSPKTVTDAIGNRKLLLLFDNCEHVIDAVASLANVVLRDCSHVTILATSRERLSIIGERVYHVPTLDVPDEGHIDPDEIFAHSGPELFLTRIREMGSDSATSSTNLLAVATICRQLDGVPLAIEFAAARAVTLGVEPVAAGLLHRFDMLTTGHRAVLPRHRTLRAVLDWSYHLLSPDEQRLLRWLAAFPYRFSLAAAIELLAGGQSMASVSDGISSLVEKSLLNADKTAAGIRYRLLETTKDYGRSALDQSGEAEDAMRAHAKWVLNTLDGGSAASPPSARNLGALHEEEARAQIIYDVRAALDWCFVGHEHVIHGIRITALYAQSWLQASLMPECRERVEVALRCLDQRPGLAASLAPGLISELYIAHSVAIIHTTGLVEETHASLERALEIVDKSADDGARLHVLWARWDYYSNRRYYMKALQAARKFESAASHTGQQTASIVANRMLGHSLHYCGSQVAARSRLQEVLRHEAKSSGARTVWFHYDQAVLAGAVLARVLWLLGYSDQAIAAAEACCASAVEINHKLSQCYAHAIASFPIACLTGDLLAAEQAVEECAGLASRNQLSFYRNWAQCLRGVLLIEKKDFAGGLAVLSDALPMMGEVGLRQPEFQIALAKGFSGIRDTARARATIEAALAHAEQTGERWCIPELIRIRCEFAIAQDRHLVAAVEQDLRSAASMARRDGARAWELRIASSLAGHLRE